MSSYMYNYEMVTIIQLIHILISSCSYHFLSSFVLCFHVIVLSLTGTLMFRPLKAPLVLYLTPQKYIPGWGMKRITEIHNDDRRLQIPPNA